MRGEHLSPNQGITEYKSGDGLITTFHPSSHETEWNSFTRGMTVEQGRDEAAKLLTGEFVNKAFSQINGAQSANHVDVELFQQGLKNAIYKVTSGKNAFILVMSKGAPQLKAEIAEEAQNLSALREATQDTRVPDLVPQVYGYEETENVGGYAFEVLPKHFEVRALSLYRTDGTYYATFGMVSNNPRAKKYNQYVGDHSTQWMNLPKNRRNEDPNYRIKTEMAARLYVINHLTGQVPKQFSVNAGDFMANPSKNDFDLKLITVRGGWAPQTPMGFYRWLHEVQFGRPTVQEAISGLGLPLFDYDEDIIQEGLKKGRELLDQH